MSTKDKLIASGAELMAKSGFAGVSVRQICAHADTTMNMIHHFFGNKQGLLDAIVEEFNHSVFESTLPLFEAEIGSAAEFEEQFTVLFQQILFAYMKNRAILLVVIREELNPSSLTTYMTKLSEFISNGQNKGFVRDGIDPQLVSGLMNDRILNQVQFAPWMKTNYQIDLYTDSKYRDEWCRANIDLILHGLLN